MVLCFFEILIPVFAKSSTEIVVGGGLADVTMEGLSGANKKLSEFRGKPLVINVWASWCGPCREEMGSLERLARRFGAGKFYVIGISTDDYRDAASSALKQAKITFPNFIDKNLVLENMLGANRIPLTVLVDGNGRIIKKIYGSRVWDSEESLSLIGEAFQIKL